ncbi:hypothetical protein FB471_1296 [Amycolatopsis cihanbeyliensis]|uniref:Uncharacterized protein n=1 Tax=Amycolatopsis cihanbeyliensis TaxID=1128664 RepID=A0A542DEV0_AMYCI|nr:hypothetical protein FB471_1296 [Amycolatopsis cihanbeyliensis]
MPQRDAARAADATNELLGTMVTALHPSDPAELR